MLSALRDAEAPITPLIDDVLADLRFRRLLGAAAWTALPQAVQRRFSKRLTGGRAVTYTGSVIASRSTWIGATLAQLCRVIGAPLPLGRDIDVPAVVSVTEDCRNGGQVWTRLYGRRCGFPQVIHSSKRFAGPTGLEEYLGGGFGIALRTTGDAEGIHFLSDHYFLCIGHFRCRLPYWLAPGDLRIDHIDRGDGSFLFILALNHPWLGELIHQIGAFREHHTDPTELGS